MDFGHLPRRWLRLFKRPPQIAYAVGLGPLIGRMVLLLTTTGRKSGLLRVTPLQYEERGGLIYVGSARGVEADWYRNLVADPHVKVRVKNRGFDGIAEVTTEVSRVTDYLELRLARHPRMMRAMLRAEGVPDFSRDSLEQYAARRALVIIHPEA